MNLILENTDSVPYFTNLRAVLGALGLRASDYDWYVSDLETTYVGRDFTNDDQWLAGETLERLITEQDIQFIWAVLSAVSKGTRFEVTHPPAAEGNSSYWNGNVVGPQLNGALFEIVSWDSSATILVGLPSEAGERFQVAYPAARPLTTAAD